MPSRFPHLKSSTDPLGLIEQLGFAVTMSPNEDAATDPPRSWFGRLLFEDEFRWAYEVNGSIKGELNSRDELARAYFDGRLHYTAYDWECTFLKIGDRTGEVRGEVDIKGGSTLTEDITDHTGRHLFHHVIVKGNDGKWRVKEWTLSKLEQAERNPIFQVI